VLATHWPVETVSARELVTRLFERYAADPKLTRAKALRLAMLDLIDRGVAVDERGKPEYSYAHPAFWAPYALYGDPGR
jgi:CHAT domain-containing protein